MKLSTALSAFLVCAPVALVIAAPPSVAEAAADGAAVLQKLDKDARAVKPQQRWKLPKPIARRW